MFSESRIREDENISSIRKHPLLNSERKGSARLKSNALGDVQNTIHSRPANSSVSNTNAFVKSLTQGKVSASSPRLQNQNSIGKSIRQTKSEKLVKPAASESVCHNSTVIGSDLCETHNHSLCEQAEQTSVTDLFLEYKLSESQIDNLVKSVKQVTMPGLKAPTVVPCTDIEIPIGGATNTRCGGKLFSVNDIFSDLVLPDVPAPMGVI